jgi:hypothetical protein
MTLARTTPSRRWTTSKVRADDIFFWQWRSHHMLFNAGPALTYPSNIKRIGKPWGQDMGGAAKRDWRVFEHAKSGSAQRTMLNTFCNLQDPGDKEDTKTTLGEPASNKTMLGYFTQSAGTGKQSAHSDACYASMMLSRHDGTHVFFYTRHEGQLVEFKIVIPEGFVLFWRGEVIHAGGVYADDIPEEKARIFGYVQGWKHQFEVVEVDRTHWDLDETCAQLGWLPSLYELREEEPVLPVKKKARK